MATVLLGRTGIEVEKNGFGALPIQRIALDAAASLLQKAYEGGIRYFDTARSYTDSEEKIGAAFGNGLRQKLYIATKTPSQTAEGFWKDLETSLRLMLMVNKEAQQNRTRTVSPAAIPSKANYRVKSKKHL